VQWPKDAGAGPAKNVPLGRRRKIAAAAGCVDGSGGSPTWLIEIDDADSIAHTRAGPLRGYAHEDRRQFDISTGTTM
jgi:hypothetical protein